jgi:hypothetical protein
MLLVLLCACRKQPTAAQPTGTDASTPTVASASASADRVGWEDARTGDPLELARLANREGALALAEVAGDAQSSEADRATAIRAIAFVTDPTPALETLARVVTEPSVERSTLALQTIAAVAPKRSPIEEVEPGGWRICADALLKALATIQGPVRRELAIRALLGLSERGAVARASIPVR